MSHIPPNAVHEITHSFLIRLTWDRVAESWQILLKSTSGNEPRLFSDLEAVLLYLEAVMRER